MKAVLIIGGILAAASLTQAQGADIQKILAETRQALGGEAKLAAVKTLTATGRNSRGDIEIAVELPDKYVKKEVIAQIGETTISRTSGFNGSGLINEVDQPPALNGGGNVMIRMAGPGPGATTAAGAAGNSQVTTAKRDFARIALGIFAQSFNGYPLHFSYAGQADAPGGKADVLEVKSDDGFAAKLFISTTTHLPLMLTWMDREPQVVTMGGPRGGAPGGGRAGDTVVMGPGGGRALTPEDRDRIIADAQRQAANPPKQVEFRLSYSDYKDVDGVKIPFTMQRSVDGNSQDAITLERVRINPKIDAKKFEVTK